MGAFIDFEGKTPWSAAGQGPGSDPEPYPGICRTENQDLDAENE